MTFKELLTGVANTIRSKKGKTDKIKMADFIDEIEELVMPAQLFAPSITIDGQILTITDNVNNGAFTEGYGVYIGDVYANDTFEDTFNVNNLNYDIVSDTTVKVVSKNDKFIDSEFSNVVDYLYYGLTYALSSDGTYYSCTNIGSEIDPHIIIKDNINGIQVTSIGKNAFDNCNNITSIEIPDSVTNIGNYAFRKCSGLTSIVIPNKVTNIGMYAFDQCSNLTNITIGESVKSISMDAFNGCNKLTNVYYEGDIGSWCDISFNSNANPLSYAENLYINGEIVTEIVIPDSITSIRSYAFYDFDNLTNVIISDSVKYINNYAFYHCSKLSSVKIGKGASVATIIFFPIESQSVN